MDIKEGETLKIDVSPTFQGVSQSLATLSGHLAQYGLAADRLMEVELACAEALNNVVEHGKTSTGELSIRLHALLSSERLEVQVHDNALPFEAPESGDAKSQMMSSADGIAEGGFGWGLIHTLADQVSMTRRGTGNCLSLHFGLSASQI